LLYEILYHHHWLSSVKGTLILDSIVHIYYPLIIWCIATWDKIRITTPVSFSVERGEKENKKEREKSVLLTRARIGS
jgi:hypothetical protein